MAVLLDTHAVIWYLLDSKNLPSTIYELIDSAAASGAPACMSVISLVEIIYLVERERVPLEAYARLTKELEGGTTSLRVIPLDTGVADSLQQVSRDQVPDMPDRIIAATALHFGLSLVTHDRRLQAAGVKTIW